MRGREWTERELAFLRANYPEHTAYWCAKMLGRARNSVDTKIKALWLKVRAERAPGPVPVPVPEPMPVTVPEDQDLGPANPPMANRCIDCGRRSRTRRCPKCRAKYLARYNGECWGPAADEGYEVAI